MTQKPETPTAVAKTVEVPSVLSEGHPQGASGNGQPTDLSFTVSIPQIGAYRTADHRYYWNGKGPLPSVTSILSVLDKPAVVQWAKRTVAEFAVRTFGTGEFAATVEAVGPEETQKWLARLPDYQKDEAGKLGSGVHLLADMVSRASESDSEAFQVSDLEKPYLAAFQGFLGWLKEQGAEIVSSEKMVWSSDGYAGTYDLIVKWPKQPRSAIRKMIDADPVLSELPSADDLWLLDIKTSKGYYPETALQLVAYGYADQIILEGNPDGYPMPIVNRYGVLHLRPDVYPDTGWRLIEYPVQDSDYVAFLGALELYRWKQEGRYTKSRLQNLKPPKGPLDSPTATQDQMGTEK